jgi:hypothetical protein
VTLIGAAPPGDGGTAVSTVLGCVALQKSSLPSPPCDALDDESLRAATSSAAAGGSPDPLQLATKIVESRASMRPCRGVLDVMDRLSMRRLAGDVCEERATQVGELSARSIHRSVDPSIDQSLTAP